MRNVEIKKRDERERERERERGLWFDLRKSLRQIYLLLLLLFVVKSKVKSWVSESFLTMIDNGEKKINIELRELENWKRSNLSLKTNVSILGVWSYFVDNVLRRSWRNIFTKFCSYLNVGCKGILEQKKSSSNRGSFLNSSINSILRGS